VYLAGFGPVKDGTQMNLYCMSGGGLGRMVDRRGSFLTFAAGALSKGVLADDFTGGVCLTGVAVAALVGLTAAAAGLATGPLVATGFAGKAAFVAGRSAFSGSFVDGLTGACGSFLAVAAAGFEDVLLDFLERGSLLESFFFSARLGRAGMGRVNSL